MRRDGCKGGDVLCVPQVKKKNMITDYMRVQRSSSCDTCISLFGGGYLVAVGPVEQCACDKWYGSYAFGRWVLFVCATRV